MSRPGFAVDIDNVLARAEREVQQIFMELTGESWPRAFYASAGGLDSSQLQRDVVETIFESFHVTSIPRLPVLPGAKLALQVLQQRYRIILITARRPTSRAQTVDWLQAHQIPFDELYFTEEKGNVPESIALAVDDHPAHAQDYTALGIPVFLMDQPWNQWLTHPLITRVTGWDSLLHTLRYGQEPVWPTTIPESPSVKALLTCLTE